MMSVFKISSRVMLIVCAVMQFAVSMPHHHHCGDESPCFVMALNHDSGSEEDKTDCCGHTETPLGVSCGHEHEEGECPADNVDVFTVEKLRDINPQPVILDILPILHQHISCCAVVEEYPSERASESSAVYDRIKSDLVRSAFDILALSPRAPSFTV